MPIDIDNFTNQFDVSTYLNEAEQAVNNINLNTSYIANDGLVGRKKERMFFTNLESVEGIVKPSGDVEKKYYNIPDVEVYIDPQNISISKKTLMSKTLTKGGWVFQCWGQDLTQVNVNMASGYYGFFKNSVGLGLEDLAKGRNNDALFIFNKIKDDVFNKRFDETKPYINRPFITMVFDGETYDGYFDSFNYTLDANRPFYIEFSFTFMILPPRSKYIWEQVIPDMANIGENFTQDPVGSISGPFITKAQDFLTSPSGEITKLFSSTTRTISKWGQDGSNALSRALGVDELINITPSKERLT